MCGIWTVRDSAGNNNRQSNLKQRTTSVSLSSSRQVCWFAEGYCAVSNVAKEEVPLTPEARLAALVS
jgi:hypothetical protein